MLNQFFRKSAVVLSTATLAISLAACGGGNQQGSATTNTQGSSPTSSPAPAQTEAPKQLSGDIRIDGSSTVFPISQAVAEEFMAKHNGVNVTVGESGSSNGIKKLISGEVEIADASRKIKEQEVKDLQAKGDDTVEMPVAYDGITVVVNKKNTFATEMTVAELKKIWEEGSQVKKWSDVRPGWPDEEIKLFGPGTASGTFEYFTEAINGTAKKSRNDYTPSEDDNVLVKGVAGDEFAMGYFGYSYYEENQDQLNAVKIKVDENAPAVAPSAETIKDGSYQPLSREIFIYPSKKALEQEHVKEFIKFYMSEEGQKLVEEAKYVRLQAEKYAKNLEAVK